MLPFLPKKQGMVSGLIIKNRTPDKPEENQDDKDASIHACAQDLITAIHNKDTKGVAEAIRSAFEIMEMVSPDEIDHEEASPHTYDHQNRKAGENK